MADEVLNDGKGAPAAPDAAPEKVLTPAAQRALAEAAERRRAAAAAPSPPESPPESGGPDGPEPTRFGDWEKGGIASDF